MATVDKDFKVKNGIDIQSPLPVSMGGTGQTTTGNTLNALLPSQAGNSSKVLSTDGTNTTWTTLPTGYTKGGTASRPGSPAVGDLYFNTTVSEMRTYSNSYWYMTIDKFYNGNCSSGTADGRISAWRISQESGGSLFLVQRDAVFSH